MAFIIDATETKDYVARDSDGPAACLEYDGNFDLVIKSIKRNEKASAAGNTTVSATLVVQDNDFEGAKGAVIYHSFPVTGKAEHGSNAGRLNVTTLIDMCLSAGRQDLADMIIGKKFDLDGLLASLASDGKSTHCYARVVQQEGKDRMESKPSFYLAKGKDKYEESKNANFRSRPRVQPRKVIGAPANAHANGMTNGAAVVVTDQLASDV